MHLVIATEDPELVRGTRLAAHGTFAGRPDAAAIARRFEESELLLPSHREAPPALIGGTAAQRPVAASRLAPTRLGDPDGRGSLGAGGGRPAAIDRCALEGAA